MINKLDTRRRTLPSDEPACHLALPYWVKFDCCVKHLTQLSAGQNRLNQIYGAKQLFVTWDPFLNSPEYLQVLFLFPIEYLTVYEEKQGRYYCDVRCTGHSSSRRRQVFSAIIHILSPKLCISSWFKMLLEGLHIPVGIWKQYAKFGEQTACNTGDTKRTNQSFWGPT